MKKLCWFILILCALAAHGVSAQDTAAPVELSEEEEAPAAPDTTRRLRGYKHWSHPRKAAFWAIVIPGGGQVYNKKYWKLPIVYGGAAAFVWTYRNLDNFYNQMDYAMRASTDPSLPQLPEYAGLNIPTSSFKVARDYYRKNRDLTVILAVGFYGLTIVDAIVDAHLKDFDVSDSMAMRIKPGMVPGTAGSSIPGLSVRLRFKQGTAPTPIPLY